MAEPAEGVEIRDNPGEDRYEVWVAGELAGFAVYEPGSRVYSYLHTEIDPGHEGRGLGSWLIRYALDDMRARNLEVLPYCPFVLQFIAKHPDGYLDLVPAGERERFGLPAP
jgi:predicted GNAT family acetyltransferase